MIAILIAMIAAIFGVAPAERQSLVMIVGDSITAQHTEQIQNEMQGCKPTGIRAVSGRSMSVSTSPWGYIPSGYETINDIENTIDPSTWIIELGVNDVNGGHVKSLEDAHRIINQALSLIDETDTVYWLTTYSEFNETGTALFNWALWTNKRIVVLDWAPLAAGRTVDGLHPNTDAVSDLAKLYCV